MEVSQVVKAGIKGSIAHPESASLVIDLLEADIVVQSDLTEYVKKDGSESVEKINLDTNPTLGVLADGDLYYDQETKTVAIDLPNDVLLHISQEDTFIGQNMSGATISKGEVVYITGTLNSQPRISLARADLISATSILGMVAEDIPNFGKGLVITRGPIEGIDTDAFFTDSTTYLSDTISGKIMADAPLGSSTVLTIQVGRVIVSNATTGKLFLTFSKNNNIADLADVDITAPIVDQVLKYNGAYWVNGTNSAVSAGVGSSFFLEDSPSIPSGIGPQSIEVFSLLKSPSGDPETVYSVTVNNSTALLKYFMNNGSIGSGSIDSGLWNFNTYASVSQSTGISNIITTVRKVVTQVGLLDIMGIGTSRTAFAVGMFSPSDFNSDLSLATYIQTPNALLRITGYIDADSVTVETLSTYTNELDVVFSKHINLFVDTFSEMNNTSVDLISSITSRSLFTINPSDRLSIAYYAKTTATVNTDISIYLKGIDHASYVSTPIAIRHNDLVGLQGGSLDQMYHMTLSEYNTLLNTSGINTGDQDLSAYEISSNKSTSIVTDQASNTKYPSVKSVYDFSTSTFEPVLGFAPEDVVNKATNLLLPDNIKYPTTLAVKTAIDAVPTDHGLLSGLADDDHSQYHNDTRGDIRYYTKSQIDSSLALKLNANDQILKTQNILKVKLNPSTGEFSSIAAAIASITGSSITNPYVIKVGPGVYVESVLNVPPYTSIEGESIQSTIIKPATSTQHLFILNTGCELSFMSMYGLLGANQAAIYIEDSGNFTQTHKISIYNFDIGIHHIATAADSYLYVEYTDINGNYTNAVKAESLNGFSNRTQLENFYSYESITTGSVSILGSGTNLELQLFSTKLFCEPTQKGVSIFNGTTLRGNGTDIQGSSVAIEIQNSGAGCSISVLSSGFKNNTLDYNIAHPNTTGSISGGSAKQKITINPLALISVLVLDTENEGIIMNGPLFYSYGSYSDTSDISRLVTSTPTMGVIEGGALSTGTGLSLNIASGFGYLMVGTYPTNILKRIDWTGSSTTLSANQSSYIYINENSLVVSNITRPSSTSFILLGRVTTDATSIMYIENTSLDAYHYSNKADRLLREAIGPVYHTGSSTSEFGTRQLSITSGEYYFGEHEISLLGGSPITFDTFYRSTTPGIYTKIASQTTVTNSQYDDGSGTLANITSGKFVKHLLAAVGGSPSEKYLLILGQIEYNTGAEAEAAGLPLLPSFISESFVKIASIVVGQSSSSFYSIIDERPRLGFASSSITGVITSHSSLTDLGSDDHSQYIRVDGTRAFTGTQSFGGNAITNALTVNGVTIESHASRHLPNGADPLTTGIPSTINTTNSEGIANAFSRQDHVHAHGNQTSATHHAAATTIANGFMSSSDKSKLDGISGTRIFKSGNRAAATFLGAPRTSDVVFSTAMPNTNYSISIVGVDGRTWRYSNKTVNGFTIATGSNTALTGEVSWTAISNGETVE